MKHTCHAKDCTKVVPRRMLMCRRHWSMVPGDIQARVYATYRRGQCHDMQVSREWLAAAREAINAVAAEEP